MSDTKQSFQVELDGLGLSKEQLARIDTGINEVVLKELAKIDHKGLVINKPKLPNNILIRGIIVRPNKLVD